MLKKGRPKKNETREYRLEIKLIKSEKQTFRDAANLAGIPTSVWVRERLRHAAIKELEDAALPIALLNNKS
jgi:hypothetical protein